MEVSHGDMTAGFLFLGAGTGLYDDLEELLLADFVEGDGLGKTTVSFRSAGLLLASFLKEGIEDYLHTLELQKHTK